MKNKAMKNSTRSGIHKLLDRGLCLSPSPLTRGAWSASHLECSSPLFRLWVSSIFFEPSLTSPALWPCLYALIKKLDSISLSVYLSHYPAVLFFFFFFGIHFSGWAHNRFLQNIYEWLRVNLALQGWLWYIVAIQSMYGFHWKVLDRIFVSMPIEGSRTQSSSKTHARPER